MRCPFCGHDETKVVDSRTSESQDAIRRRRECLSCAERFTTYERREEMPLMVVKKDGQPEPFDRASSCAGCLSRPPSARAEVEQLEALIDDIESELHNSFRYEVDSLNGRRHGAQAPQGPRQGRLRAVRIGLQGVPGLSTSSRLNSRA